MFSFHIGLPGLHESILSSTAYSATRPASLPHIVSHEDYTAYLEPFVFTRDKLKAQRGGLQAAAAGFVETLTQHPRVVFTQPLILGSKPDALAPHEPFPLAEGRIARLTRLLREQELEFHLLITSQANYFASHYLAGRTTLAHAILKAAPSWSLLVERLRSAASGRPLFVWDFEHPNIVAPTFQAAMLGTDIESLFFDDSDDWLELSPVGSSADNANGLSQDLIKQLRIMDARYDEDLNYLSKMKDVTLICSDLVL